MLVHAKRFEFDLEYMKRIKINDRFEFPQLLDLADYTAEGIARREALERAESDAERAAVPPLPHATDFYHYELRGVLVHTGTADSGHYYSFIREQAGSAWFEYNDTVVSPFDAATLPATRGKCRVVQSALGSDCAAVGAAWLVGAELGYC